MTCMECYYFSGNDLYFLIIISLSQKGPWNTTQDPLSKTFSLKSECTIKVENLPVRQGMSLCKL